MKKIRKQAYRFASGVMLAIAVFAPPATADAPTRIEFGPAQFIDIDPCTGTLHEITIFFEAYEHQGHNNNFLATVVRTGFTDSGYELFAGNELFQINRGVVISKFKDMWRNDDGRIFEASGSFILNFNQGQVKVSNGTFRCISGDTILP